MTSTENIELLGLQRPSGYADDVCAQRFQRLTKTPIDPREVQKGAITQRAKDIFNVAFLAIHKTLKNSPFSRRDLEVVVVTHTHTPEIIPHLRQLFDLHIKNATIDIRYDTERMHVFFSWTPLEEPIRDVEPFMEYGVLSKTLWEDLDDDQKSAWFAKNPHIPVTESLPTKVGIIDVPRLQMIARGILLGRMMGRIKAELMSLLRQHPNERSVRLNIRRTELFGLYSITDKTSNLYVDMGKLQGDILDELRQMFTNATFHIQHVPAIRGCLFDREEQYWITLQII
jgi:hypothetical protein